MTILFSQAYRAANYNNCTYNKTAESAVSMDRICFKLRARSQIIIFAMYCVIMTLGGGGSASCTNCDRAILQHDRGRSGRAVHCVLEHSLKVESTLPLILSH